MKSVKSIVINMMLETYAKIPHIFGVPPWRTGTFRDYMATEYQLVISKLPAMLEVVLMARLIIKNKQNTYHIANDPAVCQID